MATLTSDEALVEIRQLHHKVETMRCGARRTMLVEHYFDEVREKELLCTLLPGHEGDHKDALCCWRFHSFGDAAPQPEDVWGGRACSCGALECKTRAVLDSLSS